jgi:hypothetical protein
LETVEELLHFDVHGYVDKAPLLKAAILFKLGRWKEVLSGLDGALHSLQAVQPATDREYLITYAKLLGWRAFQMLNGPDARVPEKFWCDPSQLRRSEISGRVQRMFPIEPKLAS